MFTIFGVRHGQSSLKRTIKLYNKILNEFFDERYYN